MSIEASPADVTDLDIRISNEVHADMVDFIQRLSFGSHGLRYQRLDIHAQLQRFASPVFFHATCKDELVGSYVLDKRQLLVNRQPVTGYYRGLLSVDGRWQGNGIGQQLAKAARDWMTDTAGSTQMLSYGCIDKSNVRSLNLLKAQGGFVAGTLSMYMMYHQWPRQRCNLLALQDKHAEQLSAMTESVYGHYGVRDVSHCAQPGFVHVDADGIVISARITDTRLRITQMSNVARWITGSLVTPFAVARKRFNPDCFRYIGFSEVLIRPGSEALWPRFVSSVLAAQQCHFAAVYVDPRASLFHTLQKASGLSRLLHSKHGDICVVAQTHGQAEQPWLLKTADKGIHLWPVDL